MKKTLKFCAYTVAVYTISEFITLRHVDDSGQSLWEFTKNYFTPPARLPLAGDPNAEAYMAFVRDNYSYNPS